MADHFAPSGEFEVFAAFNCMSHQAKELRGQIFHLGFSVIDSFEGAQEVRSAGLDLPEPRQGSELLLFRLTINQNLPEDGGPVTPQDYLAVKMVQRHAEAAKDAVLYYGVAATTEPRFVQQRALTLAT